MEGSNSDATHTPKKIVSCAHHVHCADETATSELRQNGHQNRGGGSQQLRRMYNPPWFPSWCASCPLARPKHQHDIPHLTYGNGAHRRVPETSSPSPHDTNMASVHC